MRRQRKKAQSATPQLTPIPRQFHPVLLLIILMLLGAGVYLIILFAHHIGPFFISNWKWLASIFTGGVIASVFGCLISFLITRKSNEPYRQRILNLCKNYEQILRHLPEAIGGDFPRSLFEFTPVTSKKIAEILSNEIKERHKRNYSRVNVTEGVDWYRLRCLETTDSYRLWKLRFCIEWTWYNDCAVIRKPLKDFMVIVSAPLEAFETFLEGKTSQEQEEATQSFINFVAQSNLVRGYVVHPEKPESRIAKDDPLLTETYRFDKLVITDFLADKRYVLLPPDRVSPPTLQDSEGAVSPSERLNTHCRTQEEDGNSIIKNLEFVPDEELPTSIYYGYRIPRDIGELELQMQSALSVQYRGEIGLPASYKDNAWHGCLKFPPSDVISQSYQLVLEYPSTMNQLEHSIAGTVKVIENQSGCYLQYESLANIRRTLFRMSGTPTPSPITETAKQSNYLQQRLIITHPLTDLHRILMSWKVEQLHQE